MRAPLSWLREYVTVDATPEKIAERLAISAFDDVEQIRDVGVADVDGNLGRFLVGVVLEVGAHPNADRLRVCQVDVGEGDARQIICGAWNFEAGANVAVAVPGALLPIFDGPLDERKLRGEDSRGMILAEDEIGRAGSRRHHRAPERNRAGNAAHRRAGDQGPSPRRHTHAESGRSALHGRTGARGGSAARRRAAHSRDCGSSRRRRRECRRHDRRLRRLPALHRARLQRRRYRTVAAVAPFPPPSRRDAPISNVVDVTNYVMHVWGSPLHAFDRGKLEGGRIVVRRARPDEELRTLDGTLRRLRPDDLVITDGEKSVALAAIMGGAESEVSEHTTEVLRKPRTSSRSAFSEPRSASGCAPPARIAGRRASTRTSPSPRRSSRAACSSISPGRE